MIASGTAVYGKQSLLGSSYSVLLQHGWLVLAQDTLPVGLCMSDNVL